MTSGSRRFILAAVVVATACTQGAVPLSQEPIIISVSQTPSLVSPLSVSADDETRLLVGMLYEGLYSISPRSDSEPLRPVLASSYPAPVDEELQAFVVPLSTKARWHDGVHFSASDVVYSWSVVSDPRNEYPDRAVLVGLISAVTEISPKLISVRARRSITPADIARLLSFPVMPARVNGQRAPIVIHPDSARRDPALALVLKHPIGTGSFMMIGDLDRNDRFVFFQRPDSSASLVWRVMSDSAERFAALGAGELDVLLDADSSLQQRLLGSFVRLPGDANLSVALVLNPRAPLLQSAERRVRVIEMLRVDTSTATCTNRGQLPQPEFHVLLTSRNAASLHALSGLRHSLACLGPSLTVVPRGRLATLFGEQGVDAALVTLGDGGSDIAPILEAVRGARSISQALVVSDNAWRSASRFVTRDSLRSDLLRRLEREGLVSQLAAYSRGVLVRRSLSGFQLSYSGGLGGAANWRWQKQ